MTAHHMLVELVIVLGTAAVVTVVFQALRLPVVLGYVLAGLVIGPHVPVPLVADEALVHALSELGVILLMFTIGLELPLATITKVGVPGAVTALFEVGLVVALGTLVARLAGFGATEAVFAGACLGISSTMLVAKAFDELGWKGGFTEVVFAILVFEDLIAIVLLAVMTAVASGADLDPWALVTLLARLAGFLALMLFGGMLIVPRAIRWIATRARRETLVIASLVVCFGISSLAATAGYSVALGAFIGGVLIAESGRGHEVLTLVEVFRDVFSMVFFVSVGMSIDPALLASEAPRIAVFTAVVLLAKPVGVATGVFLAGHGVRPAVRAGLSLAAIGEFSFVIAGVLGKPSLLAIAVGVSCATTLVSPLLVRNSEKIAEWTAGRLPRRVATFVAFYEGWLGRVRVRDTSSWRTSRRSVVVLALDAIVLAAIVITGATAGQLLVDQLDLDPRLGTLVQIAGIAIAALPFGVSMVRRAALLARRLAGDVIPEEGAAGLGRAARRALVTCFELAIALAIVVPVVALVQPFVPGSFVLLLVLAFVLVVAMHRRISDFDGLVTASSELIRELVKQPDAATPVAQVATILPAFGGMVTYTIEAEARAVGQTLAQLDLRARTGATVLAIIRGSEGALAPLPAEPLRVGDTLALAGTGDAIEAARTALRG